MQTSPARRLAGPKLWFVLSGFLLAWTTSVHPQNAVAQGPKNATVLLIRHAEKPETGDGLAPAGEERAKAYVAFFENLQVQSQPARPQALVATRDSEASHRPRLTLEPLGKALGIPVETRFKNKDDQAMVDSLRAGSYDGKTTLVCWHHGMMSDLLRALGADPNTVLPGGHWPEEEYDWLIELRYDEQGHLQSARRVDEHLTGVKAQAPAATR